MSDFKVLNAVLRRSLLSPGSPSPRLDLDGRMPEIEALARFVHAHRVIPVRVCHLDLGTIRFNDRLLDAFPLVSSRGVIHNGPSNGYTLTVTPAEFAALRLPDAPPGSKIIIRVSDQKSPPLLTQPAALK